MKIKRIYATENGTCLKDWSKDRVILDLSENEWLKLVNYINIAYLNINDKKWFKKGRNIRMMLDNKEELLSEFKDLPF